MTDEIHIDERAIEAIQGDPERTICLVVTPSERIDPEIAYRVKFTLEKEFCATKWSPIPVIVSFPGWKIEAVELSEVEAKKLESWRDKEAML